MNREILFRGKRKLDGIWVYGYYFAYAVTGGGKLHHHIKNPINTYGVIAETVGQFTGLTDKNGNKIFEGDVLKFNKKNHIGMTGEVRFANHGSFVVLTGDFFPNRKAQVRFSDIKELEIIGNIHDNDQI